MSASLAVEPERKQGILGALPPSLQDRFDWNLTSRLDATASADDRTMTLAAAAAATQPLVGSRLGNGGGSSLRRVSLDVRTLSKLADSALVSGGGMDGQTRSAADTSTKDVEADAESGGGSEWKSVQSPPSSAALRRRRSLMSTSWAASNVTGSRNVLSKRLTAAHGDAALAAVGQLTEAKCLQAGSAAAALSERPASSSTSVRRQSQATELSECDVVLPGFRSRTLSARTAASVKLRDPKDIEWRKAFKIDYAPLSFNDVKRKRSQSESATLVAATSGSTDSGRLVAVDGQDFLARRRPWAERVPVDPERGGRVEVHYESFLPKQQWLQLRPKKFVFNHKHGAAFEKRWMTAPRKIDSVQEVTVWENPYHIILLEKATKDS